MRWNQLLKESGFERVGNLYKNPRTLRLNTRSQALDNASSLIGYKDYKDAREAFRSKAYQRFNKFAEYYRNRSNADAIQQAIGTGKLVDPKSIKSANARHKAQFERLFAKAWKARNKKRSYELANLLKLVGKIDRSKRTYGPPL